MFWQYSGEWNIDMGTLSLSALYSVTQSISVTVEHWLPERSVFAVETYFKNNNSVVLTQWIFHWHFNIHQNSSVPSCKTPLLWGEKQHLLQKENL